MDLPRFLPSSLLFSFASLYVEADEPSLENICLQYARKVTASPSNQTTTQIYTTQSLIGITF